VGSTIIQKHVFVDRKPGSANRVHNDTTRKSCNHGNREGTSQVLVVYYIANIPEHLLYVDLRRGLEVCGILAYVYVTRNHNVRGHIFGFVKFIKVRDVDKLNRALNNVFFRDNCLFAKVSKYYRFGDNVCGGGGLGEGEKILEGKEKKNVRAGAGENLREFFFFFEGDWKGSVGMGREKVLERVKEESQ